MDIASADPAGLSFDENFTRVLDLRLRPFPNFPPPIPLLSLRRLTRVSPLLFPFFFLYDPHERADSAVEGGAPPRDNGGFDGLQELLMGGPVP